MVQVVVTVEVAVMLQVKISVGVEVTVGADIRVQVDTMVDVESFDTLLIGVLLMTFCLKDEALDDIEHLTELEDKTSRKSAVVLFVSYTTCVASPPPQKKKKKKTILRTNPRPEAPLPPFF